MNYIEVFNKYGDDVEGLDVVKDFISYCVKKLKLKNIMFNVIIIDNESIYKINKEYRNINRPTDVISFALEDNKQIDIPNVRILGDIYISYDMVKEQAEKYSHSNVRELCFLTIHGLLHLLGYDHIIEEEEKVMFELQKELLEDYGIKR